MGDINLIFWNLSPVTPSYYPTGMQRDRPAAVLKIIKLGLVDEFLIALHSFYFSRVVQEHSIRTLLRLCQLLWKGSLIRSIISPVRIQRLRLAETQGCNDSWVIDSPTQENWPIPSETVKDRQRIKRYSHMMFRTPHKLVGLYKNHT